MTERLEAAKAQSQLLLGRPSSVIIMATGQSQYARNQGAMVNVCMQTSADGTTYKYKIERERSECVMWRNRGAYRNAYMALPTTGSVSLALPRAG